MFEYKCDSCGNEGYIGDPEMAGCPIMVSACPSCGEVVTGFSESATIPEKQKVLAWLTMRHGDGTVDTETHQALTQPARRYVLTVSDEEAVAMFAALGVEVTADQIRLAGQLLVDAGII